LFCFFSFLSFSFNKDFRLIIYFFPILKKRANKLLIFCQLTSGIQDIIKFSNVKSSKMLPMAPMPIKIFRNFESNFQTLSDLQFRNCKSKIWFSLLSRWLIRFIRPISPWLQRLSQWRYCLQWVCSNLLKYWPRKLENSWQVFQTH
jgi:hypothetical protein